VECLTITRPEPRFLDFVQQQQKPSLKRKLKKTANVLLWHVHHLHAGMMPLA
jgi:hypothetical protein